MALPLEPVKGGLLPNLPHSRNLPGIGVRAGLSKARRLRERELELVRHDPAAAVDAATVAAAVAAAVVVRLLVGKWDVRHLVDLVQRYRRREKRRRRRRRRRPCEEGKPGVYILEGSVAMATIDTGSYCGCQQ